MIVKEYSPGLQSKTEKKKMAVNIADFWTFTLFRASTD